MATIDQNKVQVMQGVLNTDGETVVEMDADPTLNALMVNNASNGSDNGPTDAKRNGNYKPVLMAVSESDGITPVVLYTDSTGNLLVDSN